MNHDHVVVGIKCDVDTNLTCLYLQTISSNIYSVIGIGHLHRHQVSNPARPSRTLTSFTRAVRRGKCLSFMVSLDPLFFPIKICTNARFDSVLV